MKWKKPHISKVYEALGAIGDKNRIEFTSGKNEAKIYSSSRNKFYTVTWNDDFSEMMSNDNSAFYVGQLSYPMIAVLLSKNKLSYDNTLPEFLKGIAWKDINQKFNNDFDMTIYFVLQELKKTGKDIEFIKSETDKILSEIKLLKINYLGTKVLPPKGY